MRVLHLYSGNLFGGIESILLSLGHAPPGAGVSHEFALCFDARLAQQLRASGAAVHLLAPVRVSRPQTIGQARRRLAALLASRPFDVCVAHAPWSHALFASAVRRADVPLAFWAHDAWTGRHWTERWARRRTPPDLIIANSAFTAGTLQDVYAGVFRTVVRAPLDLTTGAVDAGARRAVRAELTTSEAAVVFLQASRMEAWKGHAMLLRALAAVPADTPWACWIAGGAQREGERTYQASLCRLAGDLGIADRVRFLGERSDVPRLMAAADVYCQPNVRPEPFGVVFVEALHAGIPVVTTDLGGAREIVDSTCGRLVAAGDVNGWRAALTALAADPRLRSQLGSIGPARAACLCDPSRQLARLHDALRSTARAAAAS